MSNFLSSSALSQNSSTTCLQDIQNWDSTAEIKYNATRGGYYTDQQKPMGGIATTAIHVLNRTEADRFAHRAAIDHLVKEVSHTNPKLGTNLKNRFSLRKLLGQPVTPDSINSFFKDSSQGAVNGAWKDLQRGIAHIFPSSNSYDYEPISDDDTFPVNGSPLHSYRSSSSDTSTDSASSYGTTGSLEKKDNAQPSSPQGDIASPAASYHSYQAEPSKPSSAKKGKEPHSLSELNRAKTGLKNPVASTEPPPIVSSSILDRYNKRLKK